MGTHLFDNFRYAFISVLFLLIALYNFTSACQGVVSLSRRPLSPQKRICDVGWVTRPCQGWNDFNLMVIGKFEPARNCGQHGVVVGRILREPVVNSGTVTRGKLQLEHSF